MDSASSLGGDGIDRAYAPRRFHLNPFSGYGAFELFIVEGLPQNQSLFQLRELLTHFNSFARCCSGAKRTRLAWPAYCPEGCRAASILSQGRSA